MNKSSKVTVELRAQIEIMRAAGASKLPVPLELLERLCDIVDGVNRIRIPAVSRTV